MIGDGFTGPLNNSSSLSNSAMDCGKSAYITGANEQHFDERKLLRGDASLVEFLEFCFFNVQPDIFLSDGLIYSDVS